MNPTPRLACEQCKRRKTRCDKGSPCSACKIAELQCHTVQRTRLPRGKSGKSRAHNTRLEDRVARIETLIARQAIAVAEPRSTPGRDQLFDSTTCILSSGQSTVLPIVYPPAAAVAKFVAPEFWSALSEEVQGLRDTLDDSDDEHPSDSLVREQIATDTLSTCSILFQQAKSTTIELVSPVAESVRMKLLEIFRSRVDSVYKILHWPTVSSRLHSSHDSRRKVSKTSSVELLEASILFMAICSITDDETWKMGLGARLDVLQTYRSTVEAMLARSNLLTKPSVTELQAFVIYLIGLRTCLSGATTWTLTAVAVRAATALRLGDETAITHSLFETELRRRLLFAIGVLDTHSALDRGTKPIMPSTAFHTPPLNLNDEDFSPPSNVPIGPSFGLTDMSHSAMTYEAMICQRKLYELSEKAEDPWQNWPQKLGLVEAYGEYVESLSSLVNESSRPSERLMKISGRKIFVSLQLILRRPPYRQSKDIVPPWDDFDILEAGSGVLEQHMQPMPPELQCWAWKNWVQWHALAVVLAELTLRPIGPLSDRAYSIATKSFRHYAKIVADSESGMLWRPIAKLMRRVQRTREGACKTAKDERSSAGELLPSAYCISSLSQQDSQPDQDAAMFDFTNWSVDNHDFDLLTGFDTQSRDGSTPWLAWDAFLQDIILPDI